MQIIVTEEFIVLLPNTGLEQGRHQAETLRLAVESQPIENPLDESEVMVTLSAGVVSGDKHSDVTELIRLADEALYAAKSQGRNCVVTHQPHILAER